MFARAALRTIATLSVALSFASPAADPTDRVSEALLDVVVTDTSGVPVQGLDPRDFEVRHDGKRVEVTRFLEVLGETGPSARIRRPGGSWLPRLPDAEPRPDRPARRVALFLDRVEAFEPSAREALLDGARGLLESLLGEGEEAMIVTWSGRVRSVLGPTGDPEAIERSLEAIEAACGPSASGAGGLGRDAGRPWFVDGPEARPGEPAATTDPRGWLDVRAKAAALRALAAFLGRMEGRRALVVVAEHLPLAAPAPRPAGDTASPRGRGGKRGDGLDALPFLEELVSTANAHDVAVYGLAPRGPGSAVEGLELVASRTGGFTSAGASAAGPFFERLASELDSWYVLGYAPPGRSKGTVPVSVRPRNPHLRARTRTTSVRRSPDELLADGALANLFGPAPGAPLQVRAEAVPSPGPRGAAPVGLDVSASGLVLVPESERRRARADVSLLVVAATKDGAISEVARRRERLEVPLLDGDPAPRRLALPLERLAVEPGTRLSVGLRDERDGAVGFAAVTAPPDR